ncbi:MAG TPA: PAS domain-containing protein, partial [Desulfobacteraceae bacterium]|nr:PAS domain-containing protein [Desulfobacteraceae bacterium]
AQARVLKVNPASEWLNNVQASEVIGRTMPDLVAEGYLDRSVTLEVLENKSRVEMSQTTRDGRRLAVTGVPVYDSDRNLFRVVVTEKDITEIDLLSRKLEEKEALTGRYRDQIMEMQRAELESGRIIAKSICFVNCVQQAIKVSGVDSTVMLLGESGSGKGVIADLIHRNSARAKEPMVKVNCGAIPETLVESELFGYEKGAFTGALKTGKHGYLELADGGILFLDEIGDLPLSSQVKLLRFLEDGHVVRVGGTKPWKANVRVLAATNRSLEEMLDQGSFRLDLYYRLNIIPIKIPPLRERKDCILPLVNHYIRFFTEKLGITRRLTFTQRALDALLHYPFPGNVRELMNICERLVVMSDKSRIDAEDLPGDVLICYTNNSSSNTFSDSELPLKNRLNAVEKEILRNAMMRHGTQSRAAAALGVNQATIARKLKRHRIANTFFAD